MRTVAVVFAVFVFAGELVSPYACNEVILKLGDESLIVPILFY